MRLKRMLLLAAWIAAAMRPVPAAAETRRESFDREPAGWEGVNNRSTISPPRPSPRISATAPTSHAGGQPGEIGGRINPAGEAAYYGSDCRSRSRWTAL